MQDLTGKITGSTLTAAEWNQLPQEVQNVITALGITLGSGDLNQLGKAIAGYVANGTFYTDSGVADAYVLSTVGSKQNAPGYTDGFEINFVTVNTNTGASTVNVAGLGVKNIKLSGGADPAAGDITGRIKCVFDSSNDWFELTDFPTKIEQKFNLYGLGGEFGAIIPGDDVLNITRGGFYTVLGSTANVPVSVTGSIYAAARESADIQLIFVTSEPNPRVYIGRRFAAAITWVQLPNVDQILGVGQTWQDVTGSRAFGVTYTNTTGKPIEILVTPSISTNGTVTLSINGTVVSTLGSFAGTTGSETKPLSAIIPDGDTYLLTNVSGGVALTWFELR